MLTSVEDDGVAVVDLCWIPGLRAQEQGAHLAEDDVVHGAIAWAR